MFQAICFAIKSLRTHKLRMALTVLGVSIGIAAVIAVMSTGEGLKSLIDGQLEMFGSDLIQIEIKIPNTKKNSQENATGMVSGITITTLKDSDREAILKQIPGVVDAYSGVIDQQQVIKEEKRKKTLIFGTSATVLNIDNVKIEEGRMYTDSEEKSLARVAVLGYEIKDILFGQSDAIGETIKIKQKRFRVIGVLEERGSAGIFNFDEVIYIPLATLQKQITGIDHVSFISVKADANFNFRSVTKQIEDLLRVRHNIPDPIKDDFAVTTMEEAEEIVGTVLGAVQLLLLAVAGISLLVGGIGIMNVMYVSVKERTFEIGLRKALGAEFKDILMQFLAEAIIISFLGAIIGTILGSLVSFAVAYIATGQGFAWKFVVPAAAIGIAIGFSAAVGVFFGYWPAKTAAKKDAIKALKGE